MIEAVEPDAAVLVVERTARKDADAGVAVAALGSTFAVVATAAAGFAAVVVVDSGTADTKAEALAGDIAEPVGIADAHAGQMRPGVASTRPGCSADTARDIVDRRTAAAAVAAGAAGSRRTDRAGAETDARSESRLPDGAALATAALAAFAATVPVAPARSRRSQPGLAVGTACCLITVCSNYSHSCLAQFPLSSVTKPQATETCSEVAQTFQGSRAADELPHSV